MHAKEIKLWREHDKGKGDLVVLVPERSIGEVLLGLERRGSGSQDPVDDGLHLEAPLDLAAGDAEVRFREALPVGRRENRLVLVIGIPGRAGHLLGGPGHLHLLGLLVDVDGDLLAGEVVFDAILDLLRLPDLLIDDGQVLLQVTLGALKVT